MREAAVIGGTVICVSLLFMWTCPTASAQSIDFAPLIEILDPNLQVSISPIPAPDDWCGSYQVAPTSVTWCLSGTANPYPHPIGVDAAGQAYGVSGQLIADGFGQNIANVYRSDRTGSSQTIAHIWPLRCAFEGSCTLAYRYGVTVPWVDVPKGAIVMVASGKLVDQSSGAILDSGHARIEITGLPKLFETLLTFIPGQQTLNILMPAHPDGFRAADSLQVWTGNIRSMPDWSQAQALACIAAQDPAPGQIVTVADTLPDPTIGEGSYYLVASQSGPDRRLGRQYVNGGFSAREPAGLPMCQ